MTNSTNRLGFKYHIKKRSAPTAKPAKPVRCLNNNTVYRTSKEAALSLDLSEYSVWRILNGRVEEVKGLRFEYV